MESIFDLGQTSYWLLIIWVLCAGFVLTMMPKRRELVSGHVRKRWYWFSAVLLVFPYILWAGYRGYFGDRL